MTGGVLGLVGLVVVMLLNIIHPAGWQVGLIRVEDVAIGCLVSLAVGLVFWPGCRGEYRFPGDPPAGLVVDDMVGDLVAAHLVVVHAHRERIPRPGDD